jgi:hypothetical protein
MKFISRVQSEGFLRSTGTDHKQGDGQRGRRTLGSDRLFGSWQADCRSWMGRHEQNGQCVRRAVYVASPFLAMVGRLDGSISKDAIMEFQSSFTVPRNREMFFGTNGVTSSCLVESKARERKVHHLDRSTSGCERCRWNVVSFVAVSCDGTGNDGALAWVVICRWLVSILRWWRVLGSRWYFDGAMGCGERGLGSSMGRRLGRMGFGRCCSRGLDGVSVVGSRASCSGVVSWNLPRFESWLELLSRDLFILEDVRASSCRVSGSGLLFLWAFGLGGTRRLFLRDAWCAVWRHCGCPAIQTESHHAVEDASSLCGLLHFGRSSVSLFPLPRAPTPPYTRG